MFVENQKKKQFCLQSTNTGDLLELLRNWATEILKILCITCNKLGDFQKILSFLDCTNHKKLSNIILEAHLRMRVCDVNIVQS